MYHIIFLSKNKKNSLITTTTFNIQKLENSNKNYNFELRETINYFFIFSFSSLPFIPSRYLYSCMIVFAIQFQFSLRHLNFSRNISLGVQRFLLIYITSILRIGNRLCTICKSKSCKVSIFQRRFERSRGTRTRIGKIAFRWTVWDLFDENRPVYKAKGSILEGRYVTKRCHLHPRYAVTQRVPFKRC